MNNVSMNNERRQKISIILTFTDLRISRALTDTLSIVLAVLLVTFVPLSQYRLALYSMCIYK